jgi:glycerate dehydrogenase
MQGVILDHDSLGPKDLDFTRLQNLPINWTFYKDCPAEQVSKRIADAQIVLTNKAPLDRHVIAGASNLKFISVLATGINHIDLEAACQHNIVVSNAVAYGTASVVQHVWAMILALTTNLEPYHRAAVSGAWQQSNFFCFMDYPVRELTGKVLGIVGAGELGQAVAKIGEAFGMRVIYAALPGRTSSAEIANRVPFDRFLATADVISLHCPLTPETQNLIDEPELARIKDSAILVNSARGTIVNEQALKKALLDGHIGGAAMDVLSEEPPTNGNCLFDKAIPNLLITPHSAWVAVESRQRLVDQTVANIRAYLNGNPIRQVS